MLAGAAYVRGTLLGFLVFGLSLQHLWFRMEGDRKGEVVLRSGGERAAHVCPMCGALAIHPSMRPRR